MSGSASISSARRNPGRKQAMMRLIAG
jgi:hypothetical protein